MLMSNTFKVRSELGGEMQMVPGLIPSIARERLSGARCCERPWPDGHPEQLPEWMVLT